VAVPAVGDFIVFMHSPLQSVRQVFEIKVPRFVAKVIVFPAPAAPSDVLTVIIDIDSPSAGTDVGEGEREIDAATAISTAERIIKMNIKLKDANKPSLFID